MLYIKRCFACLIVIGFVVVVLPTIQRFYDEHEDENYALYSDHPFTKLKEFAGPVYCPHPESTRRTFTCTVHKTIAKAEADGCIVDGHKQMKPRDGCISVAVSVEGTHNYKAIDDILDTYDASGTYQLNSTIPLLYYSPDYFSAKGSVHPQELPIPDRSASLITSHCDSSNNRTELAKSLQKYIRVYSYGKRSCLEGGTTRGMVRHDGPQKTMLMKNHTLHLAFENGNTEDYVTEKVFGALAAGVVPVYLGAPNIYDFLPCRDCIINVADFNSTAALGEHLRNVLSNDTLLMSYHEWRNRPLPENWDAKFRPFLGGVHCRFCHFLYAKR
eukprot:Selendium_serpulae@DN6464_c1_g3_i2.p1